VLKTNVDYEEMCFEYVVDPHQKLKQALRPTSVCTLVGSVVKAQYQLVAYKSGLHLVNKPN